MVNVHKQLFIIIYCLHLPQKYHSKQCGEKLPAHFSCIICDIETKNNQTTQTQQQQDALCVPIVTGVTILFPQIYTGKKHALGFRERERERLLEWENRPNMNEPNRSKQTLRLKLNQPSLFTHPACDYERNTKGAFFRESGLSSNSLWSKQLILKLLQK